MYHMPRSIEFGGFVPPQETGKSSTPSSAETAPSSRQESHEEREAVEKFIDASLEELCERYLSKFNEGNNGMILKLRVEDMPHDLVEGLKKNGIELGDEKVAKILKIYSGGKGRKEFEMQKKAHELVEAQPDKEKYARIPKPYFYRDFAVGKEAQEKIKGMTEKGYGSERVEMFMMDFVPGDDVATVLYKEVIKRHEKTVDIAPHADELSFAELQDRVFQALNFSAPGGKSRDAGARELEMRKVFAENAEKLDAYLERRGFRVDPAVVSQMENTMDLFHRNGLAFRDGHQRNFMISGDYAAPAAGAAKERPPQVYVIDFGAATELEGKRLEEVFREVDGDEGKDAVVRNYPDDFMVARQLKRFTGEAVGADERKYLEDLARNRKGAERNPRLAPTLNAAIESARAGKPDMAAAYQKLVGGSTMPSEGAVDNFLNIAYAVIESEPAAKEEVVRFVTELAKRPTMIQSLKNKLLRFIRATR